MAKRVFSLVKNNNSKIRDRLASMFNGDLGRIYSILSDIQSILFLLENEKDIPLEKIRFQVGQFRSRLGNVSETDGANTKSILSELLNLETSSAPKLQKGLEDISNRLQSVLNTNAKKKLKSMGLYPIPATMRP